MAGKTYDLRYYMASSERSMEDLSMFRERMEILVTPTT